MTTPLGIDSPTPLGIGEVGDPSAMTPPEDPLPAMDEEAFNALRGPTGRLPGFTVPPSTDMPWGTPSGGLTGVRAKVVADARAHVGVPYVWGGTSPDGWDCSGAMQYLWGQFGIDLPRISAQQATYGQRVSQAQAQPGDLMAFNNGTRNGGPQAEHIAMYLGNGYIFEAPRPGVASRIRKIGANEGDSWFVHLNV